MGTAAKVSELLNFKRKWNYTSKPKAPVLVVCMPCNFCYVVYQTVTELRELKAQRYRYNYWNVNSISRHSWDITTSGSMSTIAMQGLVPHYIVTLYWSLNMATLKKWEQFIGLSKLSWTAALKMIISNLGRLLKPRMVPCHQQFETWLTSGKECITHAFQEPQMIFKNNLSSLILLLWTIVAPKSKKQRILFMADYLDHVAVFFANQHLLVFSTHWFRSSQCILAFCIQLAVAKTLTISSVTQQGGTSTYKDSLLLTITSKFLLKLSYFAWKYQAFSP